MIKGADISECGKYRYLLWRKWDEAKPIFVFIGLNPSTADEVHDDSTITRCINFAKLWGGGGIYMANLFAYRATKPSNMFTAMEPVGEKNDEVLKYLALQNHKLIACWGNGGGYLNRSEQVCKLLENELYCLDKNKTGEPKHPLYIARDCELKPYLRNG